VTDVALGGQSPAIELSRTYRSDRAERATIDDPTASGIFGPGGASNADQRLFISGGGSRVEWRGADGGLSVFTRDTAGGYGGTRSDVSLTEEGGGYRVQTNAGTATVFSSAGMLTAIEDREGRQLTFAYDGSGHLDAMTDAADRTAEG
jgi:YD repeat-containing protein